MSSNKKMIRLTQCAIIMALCYIGFQFLRIDIPVGTERTAIHMGNAFVVLGTLLVGDMWGPCAGALGLTLADVTSGYVSSAPKTFVLKLVIGMITLFVSGRLHIKEKKDIKAQTRCATIAAAAALGCNVVLDPIFGYYYKTYLIGIPQDMAATLAKIGSATTLVNALISTLMVSVLWPAVFTALKRAGLINW